MTVNGLLFSAYYLFNLKFKTVKLNKKSLSLINSKKNSKRHFSTDLNSQDTIL
jgi:hypothetical protein